MIQNLAYVSNEYILWKATREITILEYAIVTNLEKNNIVHHFLDWQIKVIQEIRIYSIDGYQADNNMSTCLKLSSGNWPNIRNRHSNWRLSMIWNWRRFFLWLFHLYQWIYRKALDGQHSQVGRELVNTEGGS